MIPQQLHAYWSGPPMPPEWQRCLDRWRELHPDWQFTLWTPDTLFGLRNQKYWDHNRWSPRSHPGQWQANLARYELLYDLGGVWVDVDLEPLRPIDDLVAGHELVCAWETQDQWVNNAFLASRPKHPALGEIIDGIPTSVIANQRRRSNHATGARYITPILADRDDVTVLDQHLIYPYRWDQVADVDVDAAAELFPEAWTVHHWANRRRGRRAAA